MATIGGPNTEKDGLVFGYDTGYGVADNNTATRFYPGETTENLIYDMGGTVTSAYPQVVYRSTATETNVVDSSAPGGKYSRFTGIDNNSNNQLYSQFSSYSIDVRGDSVNYSVYLKGSGTCHLTIYDNQSGYGTSNTITLTDEWVRYNYTRTVSASATTYWVAVRGVLNTTDVYIASQQATRGTHSTPYIENNRSATQSLIDLKRTTNIDVSNVSFNSTGQPTFDGTDDYISKTRNQYSIQETWSVELVFEPTDDSDTSWNGLFGGSLTQGGYWFFHSAGNLAYYEGYSGAVGTKITYRNWNKSNTFTQDNHHHLVITYTPTNTTAGTFNLYYNGGEKTDSFSWTFGWNHSLDSRFIGSGDGRPGTNDIHLYKEYNKALSAGEIKQNFNAYKNRFNI